MTRLFPQIPGLFFSIALASLALGSPASAETTFVDVTKDAGVAFRHNTGAFGLKWLPETMGSGVVLFDFDGDDRLDVLFLNGTKFEGRAGSSSTQALYRNRGDLRFEDVTASTGLAIEAYCMGGAAGDLDNDGDADLYLSCLGSDYLLINEGGEFVDQSAESGLRRQGEFGSSVALFDADRDGDLDVFAGRYVVWSPETDIRCAKYGGEAKSYCTPEPYKGTTPRFFRNQGDATFVDATKTSGIYQPNAKSLGVAVFDFNDDGWPDVAVSNDTEPNLLYVNDGEGNFREEGLVTGMAFDAEGRARGGMGIDAADFDRSGHQSLVIGNFAQEMVSLYSNQAGSLFVDTAGSAKIGRQTLLSLSFATFFFDYDLDGDLDLLVANGHLEPEAGNTQTKITYAQPTQLFRNDGGGRFTETTDTDGGDLASPRVARGAAYGDLDGDGDLDVVITANGGPASVFENRTKGGHWVTLDLEGSRSNRDGLGATVTVAAGSVVQTWLTRTGSSYLSQSQIAPTFGLGDAQKIDKIEVRWPSGTVQTVGPSDIDRRVEVVEERPSPSGGG